MKNDCGELERSVNDETDVGSYTIEEGDNNRFVMVHGLGVGGHEFGLGLPHKEGMQIAEQAPLEVIHATMVVNLAL